MTHTKHCAIGLWKFSDRITPDELVAVAEGWASDSRYLQLYVRKVSKDQHGIGFTYELPEDADARTAYDAYFDTTSDYLKRSFGNGFVGWDVTNSVRIVK